MILALVSLLLAPPPPATPAPTPVNRPAAPSPLVAAAEASQGEGRERVALFADGTLVYATTFRDRTTQKRKLLSQEEVAVVRQIVVEAARVDADVKGAGVISPGSRRSISLEVVGEKGHSRTFRFDDMTSLPLAVGRAVGAMADLRSRFIETDVSKDDEWDPACVAEGMLLKRRRDGAVFRVIRDDTFGRGLELAEEPRALERMVILREALPKVFLVPSDACHTAGGKR